MLRRAHQINSGDTLRCAICIVGGGAAGTVLATELGRAGKDVILLEAGEIKGPGRSQKLYEGIAEVPDFHQPPDSDRTRGLGGTSAMWGGRCMPYDPVDFLSRPHVQMSGWPFSSKELEPWYRLAQDLVDCGRYAYDSADAGLDGSLIGGFSSAAVQTETLERWSPPTHFGQSLGKKLIESETVHVVTGAVATKLNCDDLGRSVRRVEVADVRGRGKFSVEAEQVVLAGGGLESTRLLMSSDVGDGAGWLGRGYMTHVGGVISKLRFTEDTPVIFGYEQDPDSIYVRRRFTFSAEAQAEHELVNLYALLDRPLLEDASHQSAIFSLTWLAKQLAQRQSRSELPVTGAGRFALYRRHIRNLIFGAPEVLSVLPRFGRDRFLRGRRVPSLLTRSNDDTYHLYFHAEQSPDWENRIWLDPERRDALGMPLLRINARLGARDAEAILRAHELIGEELRRAGVGTLEFISPSDPMKALRSCKATLGHHIGTTRMSDDPKDGVVDANLRVHGLDNLYVASASSLPTSSQAHPTLTVLALSLRLASRLS